MLAAGPHTTLVGVWGRRPEAAAEVASANGTVAYERIEDLFGACEAVAFCLPPDVQSELATRAALAGKHLLLEKPLGLRLDEAERLADVVGGAGLRSQVVFTWRYTDGVRQFLADVASQGPAIGGRSRFLTGLRPGGFFATPWRLQHGAVLDLGPHVVDLMDAALGEVVNVRAHGDPLRWSGLLLDHDSGAMSEVSVTMAAAPDTSVADAEVTTERGSVSVDCSAAVDAVAFGRVAEEFARTVRGEPHPLDVHHGVRIQRVLQSALDQLGRS